jgi:2-methylisocitrate lyase-like PEP mutase family enzyme
METRNTRTQLKTRLQQREIVVAPGIFDLISVRMADSMGFDCLYMTGFGTVASYLGLPYARHLRCRHRIRRIA